MSKTLQRFDLAMPIGSLDAYIARVNQVAILTSEEEYELATRFHEHQDLAAARQLVMSHLRFVASVARSYSGYGLSQGDLIQEGNIGLMKAVKRFDPQIGVRLVSFAVHWIKAEIHEFILRNWRIVKIATTKAQRKLFFNLRKATKKLCWFSKAEIDEVAQRLNVEPTDVRLMEARLGSHDAVFESANDDENSNWAAAEHYLEDNRYNPATLLENQDWSDNREQGLQQALTQLDARSRDILHQRWLAEEKATLHELAEKYAVSAERVRQIEKLAMDKVKAFIEN